MISVLRPWLLAATIIQPLSGLAADTKQHMPAWWINLGAGTGSNFNSGDTPISTGAGAQLSFNGSFTPHTFITLYSNGFSKGTTYNDYTGKHMGDTGIMYGYISRKPKHYLSASAGVSYYRNSWEYRYSSDYYEEWGTNSESGAGLPVQVQAFWTPFSHFGIGFIGHGMIAGYRSASGMLAIQVF